MFKERVPIISAVYLYLEKDGRILLQRRHNTEWRNGQYGLMAGHIENFESPIEAVIREAKEEIDIEVSADNLEFIHVVYRTADEKDHERVDFFFQAHKWSGEPKNAEPDRSSDVRWFDKSRLPNNTIDLIRRTLGYIEEGKYFSDQPLD